MRVVFPTQRADVSIRSACLCSLLHLSLGVLSSDLKILIYSNFHRFKFPI